MPKRKDLKLAEIFDKFAAYMADAARESIVADHNETTAVLIELKFRYGRVVNYALTGTPYPF